MAKSEADRPPQRRTIVSGDDVGGVPTGGSTAPRLGQASLAALDRGARWRRGRGDDRGGRGGGLDPEPARGAVGAGPGRRKRVLQLGGDRPRDRLPRRPALADARRAGGRGHRPGRRRPRAPGAGAPWPRAARGPAGAGRRGRRRGHRAADHDRHPARERDLSRAVGGRRALDTVARLVVLGRRALGRDHRRDRRRRGRAADGAGAPLPPALVGRRGRAGDRAHRGIRLGRAGRPGADLQQVRAAAGLEQGPCRRTRVGPRGRGGHRAGLPSWTRAAAPPRSTPMWTASAPPSASCSTTTCSSAPGGPSSGRSWPTSSATSPTTMSRAESSTSRSSPRSGWSSHAS